MILAQISRALIIIHLSLSSPKSKTWDKDSSTSIIFGRWSQEAAGGQWESKRGKGRESHWAPGLNPTKKLGKFVCNPHCRNLSAIPPEEWGAGIYVHWISSVIAWQLLWGGGRSPSLGTSGMPQVGVEWSQERKAEASSWQPSSLTLTWYISFLLISTIFLLIFWLPQT